MSDKEKVKPTKAEKKEAKVIRRREEVLAKAAEAGLRVEALADISNEDIMACVKRYKKSLENKRLDAIIKTAI